LFIIFLVATEAGRLSGFSSSRVSIRVVVRLEAIGATNLGGVKEIFFVLRWVAMRLWVDVIGYYEILRKRRLFAYIGVRPGEYWSIIVLVVLL
jgi:hypothetical protein